MSTGSWIERATKILYDWNKNLHHLVRNICWQTTIPIQCGLDSIVTLRKLIAAMPHLTATVLNEDPSSHVVLTSNSTTTPLAIPQNSSSLYIIVAVILSVLLSWMLYECVKLYIISKRQLAIVFAEVRHTSDLRHTSPHDTENAAGSSDNGNVTAVRGYPMAVSDVVISIDKQDSDEVTRMRLNAVLPLYQRLELISLEGSQVKVVQATVVDEEGDA